MDDIVSVSKREDVEAQKVILYSEGIFYKAYGYSAFRFIRNIRPYSAKKHFYKKLNGEICSIGFPKTVLPQLAQAGWKVEKDGEMVVLGGDFKPVDEAVFRAWMESVPLSVPKSKGGAPAGQEQSQAQAQAQSCQEAKSLSQQEVPPVANEEVVRSLQEFAIETATPIECMIFLSELKRKLKR